MNSTQRRVVAFVAALCLIVLVAVTCSSRAEAIESTPMTTYRAHVATLGWLPEVEDGATAGTVGQNLRVEALELKHSAGVVLEWRGHVQSLGWQTWRDTPSTIGTTGQAKRLEAYEIRVKDTTLRQQYTVEYRSHVGGIGWQGWVGDGDTSGTVGQARQIEAVQIVLKPRVAAYKFAFTADTGIETAGKAVLAKIGSRHPDVTNIVGDLAYTSGAVQTFCDQVNTRVTGKVEIVAGNHEELGSDDGYIDDYAACLPDEMGAIPGQYTDPATGLVFDSQYAHDYFYDAGYTRVVMISPDIEVPGTDARYTSGTPEREWLKATVRDAKAAGKWTVVAMHHPCFSLGIHGCADTTAAVSDLAIGLGVDVVVTGHDHNYFRTHQIRGTKAAPVLIDSDNDYAQQSESTKGTVFAVVGNGGHNPREVVGTKTSIWAAVMGTDTTGGFAFGYGELQATPDRLSWRHVNDDTGATLIDAFTITKAAAGTSATTVSKVGQATRKR